VAAALATAPLPVLGLVLLWGTCGPCCFQPVLSTNQSGCEVLFCTNEEAWRCALVFLCCVWALL
jgi:hypothetical protein